jgi:hypothetical protein
MRGAPDDQRTRGRRGILPALDLAHGVNDSFARCEGLGEAEDAAAILAIVLLNGAIGRARREAEEGRLISAAGLPTSRRRSCLRRHRRRHEAVMTRGDVS